MVASAILVLFCYLGQVYEWGDIRLAHVSSVASVVPNSGAYWCRPWIQETGPVDYYFTCSTQDWVSEGIAVSVSSWTNSAWHDHVLLSPSGCIVLDFYGAESPVVGAGPLWSMEYTGSTMRYWLPLEIVDLSEAFDGEVICGEGCLDWPTDSVGNTLLGWDGGVVSEFLVGGSGVGLLAIRCYNGSMLFQDLEEYRRTEWAILRKKMGPNMWAVVECGECLATEEDVLYGPIGSFGYDQLLHEEPNGFEWPLGDPEKSGALLLKAEWRWQADLVGAQTGMEYVAGKLVSIEALLSGPGEDLAPPGAEEAEEMFVEYAEGLEEATSEGNFHGYGTSGEPIGAPGTEYFDNGLTGSLSVVLETPAGEPPQWEFPLASITEGAVDDVPFSLASVTSWMGDYAPSLWLLLRSVVTGFLCLGILLSGGRLVMWAFGWR